MLFRSHVWPMVSSRIPLVFPYRHVFIFVLRSPSRSMVSTWNPYWQNHELSVLKIVVASIYVHGMFSRSLVFMLSFQGHGTFVWPNPDSM